MANLKWLTRLYIFHEQTRFKNYSYCCFDNRYFSGRRSFLVVDKPLKIFYSKNKDEKETAFADNWHFYFLLQ